PRAPSRPGSPWPRRCPPGQVLRGRSRPCAGRRSTRSSPASRSSTSCGSRGCSPTRSSRSRRPECCSRCDPVLAFVYCLFVLIIGVSMRRPIGALVEARRQQANLDRELRALAAEPIQEAAPSEHLTPALARLLDETRLLRIAL